MENNTLDTILQVLDQFVEETKALETPSLGPDFLDLEPAELHEALVAHRILNKYEVPSPGGAATRKELSILEVIRNDENGWTTFDYRSLDHSVRADFLRAREWLKEFFKGFQHSYRLRFPSNETFTSARGKTDLLYKLSDLRQWTVSPDAVQYIVEILLRERALLAVVKQRYKDKYGEAGKKQLERLRTSFHAYGPQKPRDTRRVMVHFMFRACVTLVRLSRVTTVPKDNRRDRVITCESLWTMVAQLSYAASLRDHLRKRLGFDLESRQGVHRALIRSGAATIDLSKASDCNYMVVLEALWPAKQVQVLRSLRTGIFELNSSDGITYHPLRMFAPMGCGCTFEVMTLTLLAHTRVLDKGSSVFGDDIIVSQGVAPRLMNNLTAMGWKINTSKSFIRGAFRESCGAFCDLRTQRLLLSYDITRPATIEEAFVVGHKLLQLGHALPPCRLRTLISSVYAKLHWCFPRDSIREISAESLRPTAGLTDYLFYVTPNFWRHRKVTRTTGVTRCLKKFWQREVYIVMRHGFKDVVKTAPAECDRTYTACYLRRGMSYDIPTGKRKRVVVPTDATTGIPLRNVQLVSVI